MDQSQLVALMGIKMLLNFSGLEVESDVIAVFQVTQLLYYLDIVHQISFKQDAAIYSLNQG